MAGPAETPQAPFAIFCLCGSAGALSAYKEILASLPSDAGFAVIIVSHRGADNTGLLSKLLAAVTGMDVAEASDGMVLRPNCVFLSPPHMEITTDGNTLTLQARTKPLWWPNLIDIFLASLASTCASRSFTAILSGMGYDGSLALDSVNRAGGMTFAQSDADWDSMPQAALDTGGVDFFLTAAEIGERLAVIGRKSQIANRKS